MPAAANCRGAPTCSISRLPPSPLIPTRAALCSGRLWWREQPWEACSFYRRWRRSESSDLVDSHPCGPSLMPFTLILASLGKGIWDGAEFRSTLLPLVIFWLRGGVITCRIRYFGLKEGRISLDPILNGLPRGIRITSPSCCRTRL
ncbi:uncharacterized protein LOC116199401 [Punica granatum]|uniref:Uncharacterized protein LOC116199401 n=1 Tax=Punica granatum TaxID=22663 RepID=A0A6P8CTW6_PUNGR|nr:uncharacterized protein LOC116199401 [Punica granatum]